MIDLYFYPSPNTWKASIMLEECGLDYRIIPVDIMHGGQHAAEFLKVSPNGRIPAMVDHDTDAGPQSMFESGAILIYLAEKTGRFIAQSGTRRTEALAWLFWQIGGLGPMAGQLHHFATRKDDSAYALGRYQSETDRLYRVLDDRLAKGEWIAGDYGIADIASWGWVWFHRRQNQSFESLPNVERWFSSMSRRPAVQRGRLVGVDLVSPEMRAVLMKPYWGAPDE